MYITHLKYLRLVLFKFKNYEILKKVFIFLKIHKKLIGKKKLSYQISLLSKKEVSIFNFK